MINRIFVALVLAVSTALLALAHTVDGQQTQGGDQFLDGIGETGLIARYVLNGNPEDASRNQFHAAMRGTGGTFVEDDGRRVLLLTGDGSHLQLPAAALSGEDTISVTGWLFLPTGASGPVFDFGQNAANRMFAEAGKTGFRASIVVGGSVRGETTAKPVVENQWVHVAVVLDPASRVLRAYLDGAKVGEAANVTVNATQVVAAAEGAANRLFLGKSQVDTEPTLHGRLRDVRIYRIALSDAQVIAIRTSVGRQNTGRRGAPPPVISTANIPKESPWASRLSHVPDITVNTIVGMMPRLPVLHSGRVQRQRQGSGCACGLAVPDGQQRGAGAGFLFRHR